MRGHGNYIHILVTMPTCDVLLRHFCKMSLTVGIRSCTLLSLMNSCYYVYCLVVLSITDEGTYRNLQQFKRSAHVCAHQAQDAYALYMQCTQRLDFVL